MQRPRMKREELGYVILRAPTGYDHRPQRTAHLFGGTVATRGLSLRDLALQKAVQIGIGTSQGPIEPFSRELELRAVRVESERCTEESAVGLRVAGLGV